MTTRSAPPNTNSASSEAEVDHFSWSAHFRENLSLYDEPLLRQVAANFLRPRSRWPAEELIERLVDATGNAPVVDRRLKELPPGCRKLLALIDLSAQPRWHVGNLIELLTALGEEDSLSCVLTLLQNGLLYPDLIFQAGLAGWSAAGFRCHSFEDWVGLSPASQMIVYGHPDVTRRVHMEELGLPDLSLDLHNEDEKDLAKPGELSAPREADGLEFPLRLAILWQECVESPLRLTGQGDFYKRDYRRLQAPSLLGLAPADSLTDIPEIGRLTVELAVSQGILVERDGELCAGEFSAQWNDGVAPVLRRFWRSMVNVKGWNAVHGGDPECIDGLTYAGAYFLGLLLLAKSPERRWRRVEELCRWVFENHPFWNGKDRPPQDGKPGADPTGIKVFLLGVAYQLKLVEAARTSDGQWLVRLSHTGRWLFQQADSVPSPEFPQTLLVQPNLEILLYRQGASPKLISDLSHIAKWTGLGAACNLQLQPESVYMALEKGFTFESILHLLQQHGIKGTPDPVIHSLRTWAKKRERISMFPSAVVLEFQSEQDLEEAIARGVPALRLTDRLAVIESENDLQLQHFRLQGSRDYTLPPEPCVDIEDDGVTLQVNPTKSDLLLEPEILRFAGEIEESSRSAFRVYRITPSSLAQAAKTGVTLDSLDEWFWRRCGCPATPAVRLLMQSHSASPALLQRMLIVQFGDEELTDGLLQWPQTRRLIEQRLGPTAFVVSEENVPELREQLEILKIKLVQCQT